LKSVISYSSILAFFFSLTALAKSSDHNRKTATDGAPCATVENSTPVYHQMSRTLEGCRLDFVERDSIYASLGLKKGDVIQPNSGPMKMEVFQQSVESR
jgi:hypothetical protein